MNYASRSRIASRSADFSPQLYEAVGGHPHDCPVRGDDVSGDSRAELETLRLKVGQLNRQVDMAERRWASLQAGDGGGQNDGMLMEVQVMAGYNSP